MTIEKLIFCVDDDEDFLVLLAACLRSRARSHTVLEFSSGTDLLAKILQGGNAPLPDLILLDLNMPGTSGYQTLEAIRAAPHLYTQTVVVFTNSAQPNDEYFCERNNAMMLTKPSSIGELDSLVSWILENTIQKLNNVPKTTNGI